MNMRGSRVLYEVTGQAPPPSKDFHQLVVTEKEIIFRGWKISVRKDQRLIPPSQRRCIIEEFEDDSIMQVDIRRIFGDDVLQRVHSICGGDWLVRLPVDVVIRIASFLDLTDIARLSLVSKFMHDACTSDKLWKEIYRSNCDTVSEEMISLGDEIGWRRMFFTNKLQLQMKMRRQKERRSAELAKMKARQNSGVESMVTSDE